jgi:MFS family permease
VFVILLFSSVLNFVDRQIVNILAEPIKRDLHLTDWQLGTITGFSFAVFYSLLGIPIARLADRGNRPRIIAVSVAVWSLFTVACGFSWTYAQMLLARVGVGCGEGGGTPPAHSFVSELTTPSNRSSALAILSLGTPIGAMIGLGAGGLLGDAVGWRLTFVIAGLPGLILAVVIILTIREPRKLAPRITPQPLSQTIRELKGKPAFWWIAAATASSAFVVNGQGAFYSSFFLLQHGHELTKLGWMVGPLGIIGVGLGVMKGAGGIVGTIAGGNLSDRLVKRDFRAYCIVPMWALILGAPSTALVLLIPSASAALLTLLVPSIVGAMLYGPTYAAVQTLVQPSTRATAAAVLLFVTNIIGLGLGPVVIGLLSDIFQRSMPRVLALQYSMLAVCPILLFGAFCFWMAHRHMGQDLHAEKEPNGGNR